MDKAKINQLCAQILSAANQIEVRGEGNAVQVLGICQATRAIMQETRKEDDHGKETVRSPGSGSAE